MNVYYKFVAEFNFFFDCLKSVENNVFINI
jgi:hypothetical protein